MQTRRIVWSSAGEIRYPELPLRFKNELTLDLAWVEQYIKLCRGETFGIF